MNIDREQVHHIINVSIIQAFQESKHQRFFKKLCQSVSQFNNFPKGPAEAFLSIE